MSIKTFNVAFPRELADLVDQKAKEQFGSRSDFLRAAAIKYMRDQEKSDQLKELLSYGKTFAKTSKLKDEEAVAEYITERRRAKESWRSQ